MNALIEEVLDLWLKLEWRHHGTGMLQAYTPKGDARVHIWHPDLLVPGIVTSGSMHNHRYGFHSEVLVGAIVHTFIDVCQTKYGAHQLWLCPLEGAKGVDCPLEPAERVVLQMHEDEVYHADDGYVIRKGEYHWARPAGGLAVTYVKIFDKDPTINSRIVCPYGTTPVHAFSHGMNERLVGDLQAAAFSQLVRV